MTLYGTLNVTPTAGEAEVLFEGFIGRLPAHREWFVRQVRRAGGPPTDGSVESLDPLLDHVVARLREPGPGDPPDWFEQRRAETGWTDRGAALVEGLMAYTAAVVMARTGAHWELETRRVSAGGCGDRGHRAVPGQVAGAVNLF